MGGLNNKEARQFKYKYLLIDYKYLHVFKFKMLNLKTLLNKRYKWVTNSPQANGCNSKIQNGKALLLKYKYLLLLIRLIILIDSRMSHPTAYSTVLGLLLISKASKVT